MNWERIESETNKKIKLISSLRLKKYRDKEGRFIAEGIRLAEMAAQAMDWEAELCLVTPQAAAQERVQAILTVLQQRNCPVYEVSEALYKKAAHTVEPQGIMLLLKMKKADLERAAAGEEIPLLAVADGLQDPGNAGTIIRSADAAGCTGVIFLENSVDVFSDKVVRSTMGSLFHLPVIANVTARDFVDFCHQHCIRILAAALEPEAKYHFTLDYTGPSALVFGNEGKGISAELLQAADEKLYIPMAGQAESLNAAMAASVVMFEALRQRMQAASK